MRIDRQRRVTDAQLGAFGAAQLVAPIPVQRSAASHGRRAQVDLREHLWGAQFPGGRQVTWRFRRQDQRQVLQTGLTQLSKQVWRRHGAWQHRQAQPEKPAAQHKQAAGQDHGILPAGAQGSGEGRALQKRLMALGRGVAHALLGAMVVKTALKTGGIRQDQLPCLIRFSRAGQARDVSCRR